MSYKTVEVELDNGRVSAVSGEPLPAKARALLTVIEPATAWSQITSRQTEASLQRFLSATDFALTPEQFRASMAADFFEQ